MLIKHRTHLPEYHHVLIIVQDTCQDTTYITRGLSVEHQVLSNKTPGAIDIALGICAEHPGVIV